MRVRQYPASENQFIRGARDSNVFSNRSILQFRNDSNRRNRKWQCTEFQAVRHICMTFRPRMGSNCCCRSLEAMSVPVGRGSREHYSTVNTWIEPGYCVVELHSWRLQYFQSLQCKWPDTWVHYRNLSANICMMLCCLDSHCCRKPNAFQVRMWCLVIPLWYTNKETMIHFIQFKVIPFLIMNMLWVKILIYIWSFVELNKSGNNQIIDMSALLWNILILEQEDQHNNTSE